MDAIISLAKIKGQQGYFFAGTFLNYANGLTFVLLPYKVSPLRIAERKTELYYKSRFRKGHHLFFGISMTDTSLKANGNNSGNTLSSEGDSVGNSSITRSHPAPGSTMESTESEFVTKWHI
uniref:Uncharacterized protein n=1 Tax=Glossina palpalis gambiensis TaxID=67801 RepID=A0A1B0BV28_9MUSC